MKDVLFILANIILMLGCENSSTHVPSESTIIYPVMYLYTSFDNAQPEYYLVQEDGYSEVESSQLFDDFVATVHSTEWQTLLADAFFYPEIRLQSESVGQILIYNADLNETNVTGDMNVQITDSELKFIDTSGFQISFDYFPEEQMLKLCEVSAYFAHKLELGEEPDYVGFYSNFCDELEGDDIIQANIDQYGLEVGDTIGIIRSNFIFEVQ